MATAYFDTSVFLAILNKEPTAPAIRQLLRELRTDRVRIYTSIITVQEVSVLSFRRGSVASDNHVIVSKLARIETVTREIALTAAKFEAAIKDNARITDPDDNKRRKWDCFHLATALATGCRTFYALDDKFAKRRVQLNLPFEVREPRPFRPLLNGLGDISSPTTRP